MNLAGKVALVTGASRGIGRAIAVALAKKGAKVAINYRVRRDEAEKTLKMVEEAGSEGMIVQADVSKWEDVQRMVEEVVNHFGRIDILVNNAGVLSKVWPIEEISDEEWDRVLNINLKGTFYCCRAVVPIMKRQGGGKIVNISSIAGKMGGYVGCHYAASKAGVIGLTFALATELAPKITVNAVAPGPVDTDMLTDELREKLSKLTPFGRVAKPEEIAHAVIFLLENDYVSGEVVDVNAARYMD